MTPRRPVPLIPRTKVPIIGEQPRRQLPLIVWQYGGQFHAACPVIPGHPVGSGMTAQEACEDLQRKGTEAVALVGLGALPDESEVAVLGLNLTAPMLPSPEAVAAHRAKEEEERQFKTRLRTDMEMAGNIIKALASGINARRTSSILLRRLSAACSYLLGDTSAVPAPDPQPQHTSGVLKLVRSSIPGALTDNGDDEPQGAA